MKILHTGDLHLDSPFCSSGTLAADKRREMQRENLGRIFALAKEEKCDMILIAGDLFDSKYVTPETEKYLKKLFSEAGIPIVISPGNHDPYVNGSFYKTAELSDNVYIFSSNELQIFDFPELRTRVYGYAFTGAALMENPLCGQASVDGGDGYIRLLCAHADLSAIMSRYCSLTVGDINSLSVDYAALGHIHSRYGEDGALPENIRYCGFPEGRSFDELGDGGVYTVEIHKGMPVNVKRHKVSVHRYEICDIDISGCADRSEVMRKLCEYIEREYPDGAVHLRIRLLGTADTETLTGIESIESELCEKLLSVEVKDLTVPVADISSLSSDISIRGALYNALYSGLIDSDPEVRAKTLMALQIGLAAIDGRRIPGGEDANENT